ncbi:MAG: GNAT family N-acetyltransferase [Anaerolineales bacterium]|nr:GNAT family N-acetyltransferase [Anaerolineales bacterium]
MQLLARHRQDVVRELFAATPYHLAIQAALAGAVPAQIFVDAADSPQIAVVWVRHRLYLAGAPTGHNIAAFAAFFDGDLVARALEAGMAVLKLHPLQAGWLDPLAHAFETRRHFFGVSQYYRRTVPTDPAPVTWPDTYSNHPVDAMLLATEGLEFVEQLRDEMCSERNSVDEFLANSFGVCTIHQAALAGWCLSEYNYGGACEVGIETLEPHQRRGLATAMTLAFVQTAATRGVHTAGWHCWANNVSSGATARKAGFTWVTDYPAGVVWVEQTN